MNTISTRIEQCLESISNLQLESGCFESIQFPDSTVTLTTYYTSAILQCLASLPNYPLKKNIIEKGLLFLLENKSASFTWNYLARNTASPYPDDLDDTFLALLALHIHNPQLVSESVLVENTNTLIACETNPGGPYFTWIVPNEMRPYWNNIDMVTNSTIFYYLKKRCIHLHDLEDFFEQRINEKDFHSEFYDSPLVVIYFLARHYDGIYRDDLIQHILSTEIKSPLHTAIALSSLIRLGYPNKSLEPFVQKLVNVNLGTVTAERFFIELKKNNIVHHSGSLAFTYAAILEALCLFHNRETLYTHTKNHKKVLADVLHRSEKQLMNTPELGQELHRVLTEFSTPKKFEELLLLPYLFLINCYQQKVSSITQEIIMNLCTGNTLGAIGYTIQDNIFDHDEDGQRLPLASSCILHAQRIFCHELPLGAPCLQILRLLHTMNEALAYENRLVIPMNQMLNLDSFPKRASFEYLGEKSLGYAIGPMITCMLCNHPQDISRVQNFFRAYLIVKQLNDDLHDWYSDLLAGKLNPVSISVINDYKKIHPLGKTIDLVADKTELHEIFWSTTLSNLALIFQHFAKKSRATLEQIEILERKDYFMEMINTQKHAFEKGITERDHVEKFLNAYKNQSSDSHK